MKKFTVLMKTLCLLTITSVVFLSGCSTMHSGKREHAQKQEGQDHVIVPAPVRDFEIKGVIFIESTVTIDQAGEKDGSEIIYDMLMKKAVAIGGEDIANVKVDKIENYSFDDKISEQTGKFVKRENTAVSYTYKASALAIKYTKAVLP
jgi:hypothetical protein